MRCIPSKGYRMQLSYLLHGAESLLRSQLVCSQSRNSSLFTEPEGSLTHSRVRHLFQNKHPSCECFLTKFFAGRGCQYLAQPQAGGPPLVGCSRLLIQFIRSYPPYRRSLLYPQPEDAPCRDDRDPLLHMDPIHIFSKIIFYFRMEPRSIPPARFTLRSTSGLLKKNGIFVQTLKFVGYF